MTDPALHWFRDDTAKYAQRWWCWTTNFGRRNHRAVSDAHFCWNSTISRCGWLLAQFGPSRRMLPADSLHPVDGAGRAYAWRPDGRSCGFCHKVEGHTLFSDDLLLLTIAFQASRSFNEQCINFSVFDEVKRCISHNQAKPCRRPTVPFKEGKGSSRQMKTFHGHQASACKRAGMEFGRADYSNKPPMVASVPRHIASEE